MSVRVGVSEGAERIALERDEQIVKHGRTIESDYENNTKGIQLIQGAVGLILRYAIENDPAADTREEDIDFSDEESLPEGWDWEVWKRILNKSSVEQLTIAGALIAAEIDRLLYELRNTDIGTEATSRESVSDTI